MPVDVTLPPELWLIILDMAIVAGITLLEQCDHASFPFIRVYLLSPTPRGPFDNSYDQLRLVCRTFNALLGTSPYYTLEGLDDPIPTNARGVYIAKTGMADKYISQLLEESSIFHRLLYINTQISGDDLSDMPVELDLLCNSSRSLPNLQCLTFRLDFIWENMGDRFWTTLNDAFPFLRRLVLVRTALHQKSKVLPGERDTDITFRNMELLIVSSGMSLVSTLRFPSLRHVTLNTCTKAELEILAHSSLLESALFENIASETIIDLETFPRLQLSGLPAWVDISLRLVSRDLPLEHLWFYVKTEWFLQSDVSLIIQLAKEFPRLSRITFESIEEDVAPLERILQEADLRSAGLSICPTLGSGSHIVLKRTGMDPVNPGLSNSASFKPDPAQDSSIALVNEFSRASI